MVENKRKRTWILYILPFMLGVTIFKIWPLIRVICISFQEGYSYLSNTYDAIGVGNYEYIFQDQYFQQAIVNTSIIVVVVVLSVLSISLPIAWCLLRINHMRVFFQIAIFLPFVTSDIAIGMAWRILFSDNGIINYVLSCLGFEGIGWLTDSSASLWTLTLFCVWSGIPMTVLILYCGMLNIDQNIFIAARASGAREFKIFREIVLPMMKPSIVMVFSINNITAWLTINGLFPLFVGKPGPYYNLYTLVYYIYDMAQRGKRGFAYACAASCILLISVALFQLLALLLTSRNSRKGRKKNG